jgi:hypothetical protein
MFEPFKFTPGHQPDAANPVVFELKPLDNPMLYRLLQAYGTGNGAGYEDLVLVLARNIVGWSGIPHECNAKGKAALLAGEGNLDVLMWIGQCAKELYDRAILKESDRKNS